MPDRSGVDVSLAEAALHPGRSAVWVGAALISSLFAEAGLVAAFAEWGVEQDAERDGTRFEAFADALEAQERDRRTASSPARAPASAPAEARA